jgi:hypothetical protein
LGIILLNPVLVIAAGDIFHPVLVVEIPLHSFADAGFEGLGGFPAQFEVDLGGIDGVAAVVARAIGNISDLIGVGGAIRTRREL